MSFAKSIKKPVEDTNDGLGCGAMGCPMKWAVEAGNGRLCSYHAWEEPTKWHGITESLRRDGPWVLTHRKSIYDLRDDKYSGNPKGWAYRLRDKHEAGEKLGQAHIAMYQAALRIAKE